MNEFLAVNKENIKKTSQPKVKKRPQQTIKGFNPVSLNNLKVASKGEVRSPGGRGKGNPNKATIVKVAAPAEFDWVRTHTRKVIRAEAIAEQAFDDLHVNGKLVLSHARDILIRYEVLTKKGIKVVQNTLNELIPDSIKGDIVNVATNNDAVKQLFEASKASDDALDKLGKYHGYLADDSIQKHQQAMADRDNCFVASSAFALFTNQMERFAEFVTYWYAKEKKTAVDIETLNFLQARFDMYRQQLTSFEPPKQLT
jgi:hypothetical protein